MRKGSATGVVDLNRNKYEKTLSKRMKFLMNEKHWRIQTNKRLAHKYIKKMKSKRLYQQ